VRWPGSPDFEESAKAWLFDLLPARFRYEEILHRRPAQLARLARLRLEADIAAMLSGLDAMRDRPRPHDPIETPYLIDLYARERAWACAMLAQVVLVERRLAALERGLAGGNSRRSAQGTEGAPFRSCADSRGDGVSFSGLKPPSVQVGPHWL
jgi:hypothetical protein